MADSISANTDKGQAPGPTAAEPKTAPPSMSITTDAPVTGRPPESPTIPAPAPTSDLEEKKKPEPIPETLPMPKKDGLNAELLAEKLKPKPVEVNSVPETPVNGSTPAGASPRPELVIAEDSGAKDEKADDEDVIMSEATQDQDPVKPSQEETHPEPITDIEVNKPPADAKPAAEMAGALQTDPESGSDGDKKRKLDETEPSAGASDQSQEDAGTDSQDGNGADGEDAVKKAKTGETDVVGGDSTPKKVGRPKKDLGKTVSPPAGKTARKTRSQGPVEV